MNKMPRITSVRTSGQLRLEIDWNTKETLAVDLSTIITHNQAFAPLTEPSFLNQVSIEEWGHGLDWPGGLDMGADRLYDLGREQSGLFSPSQLDEWMRRNGLSPTTAAMALGVTSHMISNYRHGARPIPRTIQLACIGWETEQLRKAA